MGNPVYLELIAESGTADPSAHRWDFAEESVIGRSAEADVVINVQEISREHLRLAPRPDGWWATDLHSRNGTFVNGDPLTADPLRLIDGDLLVLAGAVTLRFGDPMATPLAPAIGRLSGVWIDQETDAVWVDARRVEPPLSARQLALLQLLFDADGEIVTRQNAIEATWDDAHSDGVSDEALAALIKRLKKRLEPFESGAPNVEIVRHRGLRLRIVS